MVCQDVHTHMPAAAAAVLVIVGVWKCASVS